MGITHFPNGVSSFGVPVLGGGAGLIPQTTGDYYFVDDSGSNANDGLDPDHPVATIDYANGLCTADHGDVIIVMPGHAETETGMALDVAGVTIVGLGYGEAMPTVTADTTAADLVNVTADSVVIKNIKFVGGASGTTALIDASADADFLRLEGCWFESGAAAPVDVITLATGADDVSIVNCTFKGAGTGLDNFILCEGYVARLLVQNCFMDSTGSAGIDEAAIQFAVSGSGPVWIDNVTLITNTDGDTFLLAVSENDPATLVSNCYVACSDFTDVIAAVTYEGMSFINNRWAQQGTRAPEGGGTLPATSSS